MNTNELAEQASQRAKETASKVKETTNRVKETAQDLTQRAKGKVRDAGAAADLYLHEYAWTTMAVVAVSAGLVGFLLGCRSRRS